MRSRVDISFVFCFRQNVTLVTDEIDCLEQNGIRTKDDTMYQVDTVIYATGFYPEKSFQTFETFGLDSLNGKTSELGNKDVTLQTKWADTPNAYLGMCVIFFQDCNKFQMQCRMRDFFPV